MKVRLFREDETYIEINDVLMTTGNEKEFKIITSKKEMLFDISNHLIVDKETKEVYTKMVEINERSF